MEVLDQDQVRRLSFLERKAGKPNEVTTAIRGLKPGMAVVVKRSEWDRKNPPTAYTIKGGKYSVRTLADKSGWAVIRVR